MLLDYRFGKGTGTIVTGGLREPPLRALMAQTGIRRLVRVFLWLCRVAPVFCYGTWPGVGAGFGVRAGPGRRPRRAVGMSGAPPARDMIP